MNTKKSDNHTISKSTSLLFIIVILSLLLNINPAQATYTIETEVNDNAHLLTNEEIILLTKQIQNLNENNEIQFAIITIPSLNGSDINEVSLALAQNHLGDSEKNNGLLLLISLNDGLYRFEVGRGIESTFNDAKIGRIGRTHLEPDFTNDQYYEGLSKTITAIQEAILLTSQPSTLNEQYITNLSESIVNYIFWIALIWILFMIGTAIFSQKKPSKYTNNQYFDAAIAAAGLFGKNKGKGGLGGFSGGPGFGGGSFGGGGATGRF